MPGDSDSERNWIYHSSFSRSLPVWWAMVSNYWFSKEPMMPLLPPRRSNFGQKEPARLMIGNRQASEISYSGEQNLSIPYAAQRTQRWDLVKIFDQTNAFGRKRDCGFFSGFYCSYIRWMVFRKHPLYRGVCNIFEQCRVWIPEGSFGSVSTWKWDYVRCFWNPQIFEMRSHSFQNVAALCGDNCAANKAIGDIGSLHFVGYASHRFNLAVVDILSHPENQILICKVQKIMQRQSSPILAAKLRYHSNLRAKCNTTTRCSSPLEMH